MTEKLKVLDLFSGIGGFSLGLERTGGFETVAFCEIEPYQRALLNQHWPGVPLYDDIRAPVAEWCDASAIRINVVTGGFPCQRFSTASRGRRVAPDLWPDMYRVISHLKPEYVIAENVSEYAINVAADDMRAIGYTVTVKNISGDDCGAPHGRSRWWAVAHPHEEGEFQRALNAEVAKLPELCASLWTAQTYARALRVSDGVPHRVHRVEALGNAVIPQKITAIGHAILESRRSTPSQDNLTIREAEHVRND